MTAALPRPTELAQSILQAAIRAGDTVIDATAGHGHDTVFLAACVGPGGRVLAFDVQQPAIASARAKLAATGLASRVEFHQTSHAGMARHAAAGTVAAVMFNFGYLPGADHELTTTAPETLAALDAAAGLLRPGGILSLICYPGHPAGAAEARAVEAWLDAMTRRGWKAAKYAMLGTLRPAPFLLVARTARDRWSPDQENIEEKPQDHQPAEDHERPPREPGAGRAQHQAVGHRRQQDDQMTGQCRQQAANHPGC